MYKFNLSTQLLEVPGIGPKTFALLKKAGLVTIKDLLEYYPRTHINYPSTKISSALPSKTYTLHLTLKNFYHYKKGKLQIIKAHFTDTTGSLTTYWFNQPYLTKTLKPNQKYYLQGRMTILHNMKVLSQPSISPTPPLTPLKPLYPTFHHLPSTWFHKTISKLLQLPLEIPETISENIRKKFNLLPYKLALKQIHLPKNITELTQAHYTLSFNELYQLQLSAITKKQTIAQKAPPLTISINELDNFINKLPFSLTSSQEKAIQIIKEDLSKPLAMNRLVLGDVGSGKTVIAATAAFITAKNNFTTFILAPTQVLAEQLHQTLSSLLSPHHLTVNLVTAHQKPTQKSNVLVGTHAILNLTPPQNLGLVIIDEEHKFGVNQKELFQKLTHAHKLSLSATPIPRSLTLTLFSHLNIILLTDKPKNRKPIKTYLVPQNKRSSAYSWIKEKIEQENYQVFFVAPLIEDSSTPQLSHLKSATQIFKTIKSHFPNQHISLLHGKLKEEEKLALLHKFKRGEIQILVSTTVIEVGIDVPEANIIVIESAERFGLSQLHQLRGRVGRSHKQGYCLLFPSKLSKKSLTRLKKFQSTQDGAELAKFDLQTRGPGELLGTKQHGFLQLKLANIFDEKLVTKTYQAAKLSLENHKS